MDSFSEKLNNYKIPIALSFVGLILIIGGIFSSGLISSTKLSPSTSKSYNSKSFVKPQEIKNSQIKVDVSGAVKMPGVYELDKDSRVEQAVIKAGGFSASASASYISKSLNLSQKLNDGQKIYIPFEGESGGAAVMGVGVAASAKVGLNSASQAQLENLPGIGPSTAQKIIINRPYSDISELLSKKSVSAKVFEKIKDLVETN